MKKNKILLLLIILHLGTASYAGNKISLKQKFTEKLYVLVNDLLNLQTHNKSDSHYGALFCKTCSDYHTRASESVMPFAVAFKESNEQKYLDAAISTGDWLIKQQQFDGSWFETPSTWTGTTADQLLMIAAAYPILENKLGNDKAAVWKNSIKRAADWIVKNMNHEFATINYCATSTATLMVSYQVIHDSSYVKKAKELAHLASSKFDEDYFLTGEGNRIRGTKYGIDYGYDLDMSLWGLGLYSKLSGDTMVNNCVRESLKRMVYFIYPDGSTDGSWGVRSSKWTTFGSFTADGCQILFSLYAKENPVYRTAALANLDYLMSMRVNGLLTYGPNYSEMFDKAPCIYPTFCRAKNLAMAIIYGDQGIGEIPEIPTQKTGWVKYFKTLDLTLIRTNNIMATVTGYRYKDIRQGSKFKYMFRPSGGSITNLWVKDYGYLQASGQTEYHQWEMNYPEVDSGITITPRIEFADSNAYYTNLYEFDSHMEVSRSKNIFTVETFGELKDKNRWEGGVAYTLTHKITNNAVEKHIKLRFHGSSQEVKIIEPVVQNKNTIIKRLNNQSIEILGGKREFIFELLDKNYSLEIGTEKEKYKQPFPSINGLPLVIRVRPDNNTFIKEISYRISIKK